MLADLGGQVTVNGGSVTTNGGASIGVEANGAGSLVTLTGAVTAATNATGATGLNAYGLYATGGATIDGSTATSVGVTTFGMARTGSTPPGRRRRRRRRRRRSRIAGATVITNGTTATGVLADLGGQVTVNGGSVTTNGGASTRGRGQRRGLVGDD